MSQDLLFEIGCEEIPAAEIDGALAALPTLLAERLESTRLTHAGIQVWGAPRRLAARVQGLPEQQPDLQETLTGPPERVAFQDGQPTKAAEKFAEKAGVAVEQLTLTDTPKGRYVTATHVRPGEPAAPVLARLCRELLDALGFRKSMRWAARPERFVRPVRWLVALLGDTVLDVEFAGVRAGRESRGHRFHAPEPVTLPAPRDYEATLESVKVIPDRARRRDLIAGQITALEAEVGARVISDEALLSEVANLVEWPVAVCGRFDERFLQVPREVIVSAMRGHQRYFAMEQGSSVDAGSDAAGPAAAGPAVAPGGATRAPALDASDTPAPGGGALTNRFVTVLGTAVEDLQVAVRGNERVLAARLADARFFWDEDRKAGLDRSAAELKDVVFQAKLGTVADKVARVQTLAGALASRFGADPAVVREAARLCKADLVTHMVGEFPDLQGVMGRYYALEQGEPAAVADAILEHYQPRAAGAPLPPSAAGATLAVADRLDTLMGCLGAGLKPRGGGDPFGLRRAALGVLRMLIARGIPGSLESLVAEAAAPYRDAPPATRVEPDVAEGVEFLLERLRGLLAESASAEIVQAVFGAGGDDPLDLSRRVAAVHGFAQTDEYAALATTFRRMNILKQADLALGEVDAAALTEPAERALFEAYRRARDEVTACAEAQRYERALEILAGLRPPVDDLFDQVKVMADDPAQRGNRLALVSAVDGLFRRVADFKRIAG
jgi:glycyl-tRNA synthetase beta chain